MRTPYFLIHEFKLEQNISKLKNALQQYWRNYIIGYSFKTNALPYLLAYMKKKGLFAEVVSENEYRLAKKIGFEKEKIIYNGPVKGKQSFLQALEDGAIVNIDSKREILWMQELNREKEYSIGIRASFNLEHYCPGETSAGSEGSRFGFCYENGELRQVLEALQNMKNIKVQGIHLHSSTKTRSLGIYKEASRIACEIAGVFSLDLSYVDIGGGFFGGLEDKPQFDEYIEVISKELQNYFSKEKLTLIVEPGTSLVSSPVDFVTSVLDIRESIKNKMVTTDGSRINIDPLMRKSSYFFKIEYNGQRHRKKAARQIICGFTCMEDDRVLILENEKELMAGDMIVYQKVGAYTMCLNPLFIQYFPAVYWKNEKGVICVREHWTEENYIQNSFWEDR